MATLTALKQYAVLWAFSGYTNRDGQAAVSATGVEIKCRQEPKDELVLQPSESPVKARLTLFVDRDIDEDSEVWLGRLADVPSSPTPLYRVIEFKKVPNIKGRNPTRSVVLQKVE